MAAEDVAQEKAVAITRSTDDRAKSLEREVPVSAIETGNDKEKEGDATYFKLLQKNRSFRLYILSYIVTHIGEWFTYIASIALVEELLGEASTSSRTAISVLVVIRLLPNVLLSPLGGILADGRDRRQSMIALDLIGAISPLLFFFAMYFKSIKIIYVVTFLQQCIAGLYEPCRSAIIPLLVPEEDYLKKATTLAGLCWSVFAAVGSTLGGLMLTGFGFSNCFILDSMTYLASAYLMWLVGGTWNASVDPEAKIFASYWDQLHGMAAAGAKYLWSSFWGGLIFLKASGGIIYGAADVLNVTFSEPDGIHDENSPARLGLLFAFVGIGCFVGPLLADPLTDMKRPASIQKACILSLVLMSIANFGMGMFPPFWTICVFTVIRAFGSSTNWIYSSLLLQKFSTDDMMGRVLAIDYALALLMEASTAYLAGFLQDKMKMSAFQISLVVAAMGGILSMLWIIYDYFGKGAGTEKEEGVQEAQSKEAEMVSLVEEQA